MRERKKIKRKKGKEKKVLKKSFTSCLSCSSSGNGERESMRCSAGHCAPLQKDMRQSMGCRRFSVGFNKTRRSSLEICPQQTLTASLCATWCFVSRDYCTAPMFWAPDGRLCILCRRKGAGTMNAAACMRSETIHMMFTRLVQ
jgi:hypothetical protein